VPVSDAGVPQLCPLSTQKAAVVETVVVDVKVVIAVLGAAVVVDVEEVIAVLGAAVVVDVEVLIMVLGAAVVVDVDVVIAVLGVGMVLVEEVVSRVLELGLLLVVVTLLITSEADEEVKMPLRLSPSANPMTSRPTTKHPTITMMRNLCRVGVTGVVSGLDAVP